MSSSLIRPAHSKVNLHLAVGLPYPDGYHPIQSLFALTSLSDFLEVTFSLDGDFAIEVFGLESYCKQGEDTLTKAAKLYHEASGLSFNIQVKCTKNIPVQAGLGGGSSDAATLLLMLQEFAGKDRLDTLGLEKVGLKVGSDVPFFLSGHAAALVSGRGEVIEPIRSRQMSLLLVMPRTFTVSTGQAYKKLDEMQVTRQGFLPNGRILEIYEKDTQFWKGLLYNDFMTCIGNASLYEKLSLLSDGYPGFSGLSGSGACWFFVTEDESNAQRVQAAINSGFGDQVQCWLTDLISNNADK